jgi:hypothetical protein
MYYRLISWNSCYNEVIMKRSDLKVVALAKMAIDDLRSEVFHIVILLNYRCSSPLSYHPLPFSHNHASAFSP